MFDALRAGQADVMVVAWKDRFTRFRFEYLKNHAEYFGVRIEVVNKHEEKTPQQKLVAPAELEVEAQKIPVLQFATGF